MKTLDNFKPDTQTRILLMGESGSGKTSALASLVCGGRTVKIIDLDAGLEPLFHIVNEKCPEKLGNVSYETFLDKNSPLLTSAPITTAAGPALNLLEKLVKEENIVLVIDSLAFLGNAIKTYMMSKNRHAAPQFNDWSMAADGIRCVLDTLLHAKCDVIVNTHVDHVEDINKALPVVLGRVLRVQVGRYFNNVLLTKRVQIGGVEKRVIRTKSEGLYELKCAIPNLPDEIPLESGLQTILEKRSKLND